MPISPTDTDFTSSSSSTSDSSPLGETSRIHKFAQDEFFSDDEKSSYREDPKTPEKRAVTQPISPFFTPGKSPSESKSLKKFQMTPDENGKMHLKLSPHSKDETGDIYLIENKRNHKKYIGQTKRRLETRLSEHVSHVNRKDPKGSPHLYRALIKEPNNFFFSLIDQAKDKEELNQKEIRWIRHFKSTDPKNGYNLTPGGEGRAMVEKHEGYKRFYQYIPETGGYRELPEDQ